MPRTEMTIMDGWQFALGKDCPEKAAFQPVTLPHDWALTMPLNRDMPEGEPQGFYDRWSVGWYRKNLNIDKQPERRYALEFGGIMENSTIWVNGKECGMQHYGYSTFSLDVTDFVTNGENEILIRVDNTVAPADRWYSGCGIYRTVKWIETEKVCLNPWEVVVTSDLSG